ncbi:right-handed parallel beta-helix repeat-containing protein [Methanobrevibacter sp.]
MRKIRKPIGIMLLSLLLMMVMVGAVQAEDNATDTVSTNSTEPIVKSEVQTLSAEPDSQDLVFNVTNDNIDDYFVKGTINSRYSYATLFISEDMDDCGILTVKANNLTINGNGHVFKNTMFSIEAKGVTLNNLTICLDESDEDNDYAAIDLWRADDTTITNVKIDFNATRDTSAYGIYSQGTRYSLINNLRIINTTVNINGDNRAEGRVYGIRMEYSPNAILENNTINANLPLHTVAFMGTTADLDSEFCLAVGVSHCDNLLFNSNVVNTNVNVRPECAYPTLDSIFICDSANCNITDNVITLIDDITFKDEANYLYALDGYRVDNLLIEGNRIRVGTAGGAYAAGTAYPIQLTGPASDVLIQHNNLYSKSNGPNIGIYSHNFNGDNYITILNNYINVTGRAGNHSWALVAGIESQDNNDIIMNNIIEVHNTGKVELDDNIYGISYSQETDSTHTYRVVNNTVISDGYYVSHMLDADNTTVTNNTLVRTDKYADTNYDPFKRGDAISADTDESKNNDFSGNRVITIFEYGLEHQSDEVDGGDPFVYVPPENVNGRTNVINGSGIVPQKPGFPGGNPLIPGNNGGGSINTGGNSPGGFHSPDADEGDNGYNGFPDLSGDNGESLSRKPAWGNNAKTVNSFNNEGTASNSYNNNVVASENSTSSETPSVNGITSTGKSSSSASSVGAAGSSGASQDSSKAYEITKSIVENGPDDILKFIALAVVCEILLVVGYRRKENEDIAD